jgi:hypothetical protein
MRNSMIFKIKRVNGYKEETMAQRKSDNTTERYIRYHKQAVKLCGVYL